MNRFLAPLFAVFAFIVPDFVIAATPAEVAVKDLFQAESISALTFSPNGKYIACLVPYEHRRNLAVIDLEKGTKNLLTNFKDKEATQPFWASNDRLLFAVDDDGKEAYAVYAVNRDGKDPVVLSQNYSRFGGILRRIPNDPKNVLVLAYLTYSDWPDVAIMSLKTGSLNTVVPAPGRGAEYVLDHNDKVRIAVIEVGDAKQVLYRSPEGGDWIKLTEYRLDQPGWEPIAFDGDNRTLFVASNVGRETRAIYRYDVVDKKMLDLVFADDTYDVDQVIFDQSSQKVVGLYYAADRTRFHWLDSAMEALQAKIASSLPDTVHRPVQFSEDGKKIIFFSRSDRDPGVYYLYDKGRQKLEELAVVKPQIDPQQMARMKPISYAARDGLELHGYLTLPTNAVSGKKLPLVIHPHGGPFGIRDGWGFDPEVQLYANRGFAVLQINYRGSGGYGGAFEAAGYKKWGLEMQNDLTDGVKWAVAEGIADPDRVVISGASYGGYATMAGLTMTPELYCAGINYVGLADIEMFVPKAAPAHRMYWWNTRIGDLNSAADRKRLRETSPVNLVDRIRVPVLMAYGKNDPRVQINQGYDLERAMKKAGKTFEMLIEKDEGHGFHKEEKSIAFYTKVDEFLKKNVPGISPSTTAADQLASPPKRQN